MNQTLIGQMRDELEHYLTLGRELGTKLDQLKEQYDVLNQEYAKVNMRIEALTVFCDAFVEEKPVEEKQN